MNNTFACEKIIPLIIKTNGKIKFLAINNISPPMLIYHDIRIDESLIYSKITPREENCGAIPAYLGIILNCMVKKRSMSTSDVIDDVIVNVNVGVVGRLTT